MSLQRTYTLKCGSCHYRTKSLPEAGAIAALNRHTNSYHRNWYAGRESLLEYFLQQQYLMQQQKSHKHIPQGAKTSPLGNTNMAQQHQQKPASQEAGQHTYDTTNTLEAVGVVTEARTAAEAQPSESMPTEEAQLTKPRLAGEARPETESRPAEKAILTTETSLTNEAGLAKEAPLVEARNEEGQLTEASPAEDTRPSKEARFTEAHTKETPPPTNCHSIDHQQTAVECITSNSRQLGGVQQPVDIATSQQVALQPRRKQQQQLKRVQHRRPRSWDIPNSRRGQQQQGPISGLGRASRARQRQKPATRNRRDQSLCKHHPGQETIPDTRCQQQHNRDPWPRGTSSYRQRIQQRTPDDRRLRHGEST